ncbi:MAG: hypothetical protein IPP99_02320 [Chitinophagaceae bacterium]|nr:hypothetical protein [Chitinophagaceae bacterium]
MDDLENLEINHKNKLYGWANKTEDCLNLRPERKLRMAGDFLLCCRTDGENIGEGKAFNKKDAHKSQHRWPWKKWESLILILRVMRKAKNQKQPTMKKHLLLLTTIVCIT